MKRIILPYFFYSILLVLSFTTFIFPQSGGDPFNWTEPIKVEAADIFLLWNENLAGTHKSYQKVYRYKNDSTWLHSDSMISKTPRQEDSRTSSAASLYCDAASGKFNHDPYDDAVGIWQTQSGIEIMIPKFDTTQAMWTTVIEDNINMIEQSRSYVRTGNFDSDSLDEFIVAYLDQNDSVHINLYDVDSTLQPSLITTISDVKVIPPYGFQFVRYFIETGDFNGDGTDEIALIAAEIPVPANSVRIKLKIYDVESGTIVPKGQININVPRLSTLEDFVMSAASGQFKNDDKEELAFSALRSSEGVHVNYIFLIEISNDLSTISLGPTNGYTQSTTNGFAELGLAAGDLNNDGLDEVVFTTGTKYFICEPDANLNLPATFSGNIANPGTNDYKQSYNYVKIKDVNQDNRGDIIIVKNFVASPVADGFFVVMITANDALNQTAILGRLIGDEPQLDTYQPFAIAVGNFDGFDFSIGQPLHYTQADVVQPIVILNAPPVHFDVINGISYDVNECYNGGDCDFYSKYVKTNKNSVEVTTKVQKDWAISTGIGGSGSVVATPLGAGATFNYEAYLLYNHGRHFSNDTTNISTITIRVEAQAIEDDLIYSTVSDYDLWEYPVYHGNENFPRNTILTVVPNNVRGQWFPSKSYSALSYIPDHEVGNILSYYPYDTLTNNPNASQTIRANYVSDSYTLSGNSLFDWYLRFSDFKLVDSSTSRQNGMSVKVSYIFIFQGNFNKTRMSTHRTTVLEQIELQAHLGSVNMGLGDVKYTVTPYSYWAQNDALVLDYAVKPELAPPGFPNTWWQDNYMANSDPTFSLPWHLDPEKGFPVSEEAKRFQTNDILMDPVNPLPGDTLTITTRVRNYSLIPTPSAVTVSFYIGDPDSGGVPIIGINGSNTASTIGPILSRYRSDVEFKTIVPQGLPSYPRIYAVLDRNNTINEIHENNNKGFNVLGRAAIPTDVEIVENIMPDEYMLYQSYPNPFNPETVIKYSLPSGGPVSLKVYDILGSEVAVLVDDYKTAGTHSINFNGSSLASGVYIYQLRAGNFTAVKKMLMIK